VSRSPSDVHYPPQPLHVQSYQPARPTFSLAALADFVTVGTPPAIHQATAAFDDVIATADDLLALADILKVYEFGEEDRTTPGRARTGRRPRSPSSPSRRGRTSRRRRRFLERVDRRPGGVHTAAGRGRALLGYELGLIGERSAALARDTPGRDDVIQAFCNGKSAGLAAFRAREAARVAREKAWEVGDDMGYHGFLCDPPYAMTPDEHRAFLGGYAVGEPGPSASGPGGMTSPRRWRCSAIGRPGRSPRIDATTASESGVDRKIGVD
jgi:hypothetical protein